MNVASGPPAGVHERVPAGRLLRAGLAMVGSDLGRGAYYTWLVSLAGGYWVPRPLRLAMYRLAGVRVRRASIGPKVFIGHPGSHLSIDRGASVNIGCFFDCLGRVQVGRRAMLGMGVTVVTSDHPLGPDGRPGPVPEPRDVVIGAGAWLGARTTILPGVTIGEGAVVSAGSVVTRDCRPFGLYAGVPARLIQQLPPTAGPADGPGASQEAEPFIEVDTGGNPMRTGARSRSEPPQALRRRLRRA